MKNMIQISLKTKKKSKTYHHYHILILGKHLQIDDENVYCFYNPFTI